MFQLAILPGPKTPEVIDSFLNPIVAECKDLSEHGMIVRRNGVEICRAKVNLVMATGDIPAVGALARHAGFTHRFGCRICGTKTEKNGGHTCFKNYDSDVRRLADFFEPDEKVNI